MSVLLRSPLCSQLRDQSTSPAPGRSHCITPCRAAVLLCTLHSTLIIIIRIILLIGIRIILLLIMIVAMIVSGICLLICYYMLLDCRHAVGKTHGQGLGSPCHTFDEVLPDIPGLQAAATASCAGWVFQSWAAQTIPTSHSRMYLKTAGLIDCFVSALVKETERPSERGQQLALTMTTTSSDHVCSVFKCSLSWTVACENPPHTCQCHG